MFVPKVYIAKWREFVQFLRQADLIVYSERESESFAAIDIEAWSKKLNCVVAHSEPELILFGDYRIMGRAVSTKRLNEKLKSIERECQEKIEYPTRRQLDECVRRRYEYERKWWKRRLQKVKRFLRELGAVEGHFEKLIDVGTFE